MSRRATTLQLFTTASVLFTLTSVGMGQVLNDPLQGSTIGTRENGAFVAGGWQVTNQYDTIYWHVPVLSHGSFEYNVSGLGAGSCPGGAGFKNELSHMYDWTFGNADTVYSPGYRDNPYKQFIRKQCEAGKMDTLELVWAVNGPFFEVDSGALAWNAGSNYLWKTEWENTGGNAVEKIYRDGILVFQGSVVSTWNPAGQSVRIAASPRRADEGANVGAIYSNVKVFDLNNFIPGAPTITAPTNGETVNTQIAYIQWTGDSHSRYQVRVNNQNNPDAGIISDTGQVDTDRSFTWSGTLPHFTTCYAFVRLGSSLGWGAWSAGRQFTINTQFIPGGTDYVRVKGNTYANNTGPFLGLGFTHMRGMQRCKYDRPRFESDVSYMASKKFTYQRILTMVDWCALEIAPLSYNGACGGFIPAWSDYWQQFRDCIDIAYGYGLKTEITIFAGAQRCMPNKPDRFVHMDNILANMPGREHKIALIEVANESWQNGVDDADCHEFGQYLADRTTIPVALSSPADTSDAGIVAFHAGSAADISTVHFSRDIGTIEGGWYPVRDSYRTGIAGVPPVSSNEPIGPGSSVSTENDPIKLCMAGCFAWNANLISYVLHSRAGVYSWTGCCPPSGTEVFFSTTPGTDNFDEILPFLPKDLASWERNDGKAGPSPFTSYSMGQANKWWPEVGGATNGCSRNISAIKNGRFVTTPIGILGGGVQIQARRPMQFKAYNPLTGGVDYNQTLGTGASLTLAQGTGAYVIIGDFTDVPIDPGETTGAGGAEVNIDIGTTNIENGMTHPQVGDGNTTPANIGGRDCRRNVSPSVDGFMYFGVNDGYAFNGSKPNQFIRMEYYDTGTGNLLLQYDAISNPAANGPSVALTNTNTWKVATFNVTDAYFGNRLNGADYRIARGQVTTWYLDKMSTYQKAFNLGGPVSTPGTIQAEDFDNGGEDVAYNDVDAGNNGGQYRLTENVDIETCNEGGFNVGWVATGEYLTYQVNVTSAGSHDFGMRVAASAATTTYHIEMNGVNVTGTRTIAATGGIQTWATQTISNITLSAGVQTMKLVIESSSGNANINYITLGKHQGPFGGTARAIPGIIQAEDFDDGGQDVAYNDAEATNFGGAYRTGEGVDITTTTDTGGGYIVGWVVVGEWMEYTVNVNQTGDYAIKVRLASASGGGLFHLSMNDVVITPTKFVGDTAGWDTWTTIIIPGIFLTAGNNQVLRFTTGTSSGFNINHIEFVYGGADVVSYDLGSTSTPDGMDHPQVGDGNTIPDTIVGHDCHGNLNPGVDFYMYFSVADIYAFQGNKNNATITFDYLDNGTGTLTLQYDGTPSPYTIGQSVNYTNTTLWKTGVFTVGDAYFGNRQNAGADFRIARSGGVTFYLDTIMVFSSVGTPPPAAATNPSPANGATLVAITTDPSWTAGSGATSHDVRFGTVNPPPFVINQTGTTYAAPTLTPNTLYYWRIDEVNAGGTTTGTVWSFTTLPLPGAASAPNPANGATLIPITTDPSWTAGSNAASHDVRFGTVNPPPFVVNQTSTTYAAPTLSANTLYYWRIDEVNTSGTTTGTVWSFTTLPLPGAASAPNPANGATGVVITADPSWTAGSNAASHDVRFGTVNPPPFVVNQTSTTYAAPTLSANTLYYWRIDEVNTSGTTTGTVWSFTTLPLPGAASSPSPANGATLVAITTALTWTAGSNAASHDVRFGTANPPPFIQNQAGTSYNPTKSANTLYYWRIDEVNSSGTTTGTVWSFTTLPVPGAASSPSPANGATLVAITTALTWTAGSNASSHDVRFGTANPPPFIQNQAGTSYNPTKNANTLYYWRIDEVNSSGTTTGTVWSFTTLPVPGAASAPNPASGATGVSVTPTLTWTAGSNATSHDVRFGTANPPPFVQNQAGTSYAPSTLAGGTLYYWRIDEVNSSGSTTGTVWSFTTAASIPNYIQNSGFEGGFGAAGGGYNGSKGNNWTPFVYGGVPANFTFADETGAGNFDSGAHSQKVTAAAGTEGGVYNQFSVTNGNTYTVTVRVKSGSPAAWCFLGIHTAGGTDSHEASGTIYPANNNRSTSWTTLSWTGTATGSLITVFLDTYDGVGYWDTATPGETPVTFSNSAFPSNADGWNIVVWKSGPNSNGTMAWSSSSGNPSGNMLSGGSGATNSGDNCTREGGEINKLIATTGHVTNQVQYDLRFSTVAQTAAAPCFGTCAGGVLLGDCADKIAVWYSTAGTGGPWTLLESVNADSVSQNVWLTRTINLPAGADNQANFALRFRWQFNTSTDSGRLDNIKVIDLP